MTIAETSGNSFIDDNHHGLLEHILDICASLKDNWNPNGFKSSIRDFIVNLENHFSHEEIILKGANYKDLDAHTIKHREVSMYLRMESLEDHDYDAAVQFIANARSRIFSHELLEDQDYWPVFELEESTTTPLITWSTEFDTGDPETDKEHNALVNFINRLDQEFSTSSNIEYACNELKSLSAYSEYHFHNEERSLGKSLRVSHKTSHEKLIFDLNTLIKELETGVHQLDHVGNYLKYWLLNHIQKFDVPAYRKKS